MLTLLAGVVTLACILASGRSLAQAVSPTPLDATLLREALTNGAQLDRLRAALSRAAPHSCSADSRAHDSWERDLLDAAACADERARDALIDEQVLEADWRTQSLARVPRVCASVATSVGFLCASIIFIRALGSNDMDSVRPSGIVADAITALTLGLLGTSFSVAVHVRARTVARQRRSAIDMLVDRLRTLTRSAAANAARATELAQGIGADDKAAESAGFS